MRKRKIIEIEFENENEKSESFENISKNKNFIARNLKWLILINPVGGKGKAVSTVENIVKPFLHETEIEELIHLDCDESYLAMSHT